MTRQKLKQIRHLKREIELLQEQIVHLEAEIVTDKVRGSLPHHQDKEKTNGAAKLSGAAKPPKQITLECIWCDAPLHFNAQHGFWRCPDCGGEWWPGPADPEYGITTLWRDEQAYKKSISKPGGGSRTKSKKNRKDSTKTPQPWLHET